MEGPGLLTAIDDGLVDRVLALNTGVKRLNLARNAIADVTPAVARLAATLTALDVGHNQLRRLGPAWAGLPGLTSVLAASNEMCVCGAPRARSVRRQPAERSASPPRPIRPRRAHPPTLPPTLSPPSPTLPPTLRAAPTSAASPSARRSPG